MSITKKRALYQISNFLELNNVDNKKLNLKVGQKISSVFKTDNFFKKYLGWIINIEKVTDHKYILKLIFEDGDELEDIFHIKNIQKLEKKNSFEYFENNFKKQKYINPYFENKNFELEIPNIICDCLNSNNRKHYNSDIIYYTNNVDVYFLRINEFTRNSNKYNKLYIGKIVEEDILWHSLNYKMKSSQFCFDSPIKLNNENYDKVIIQSIDNVKESRDNVLKIQFDNLVKVLFDIYCFNFDLISEILGVEYYDIQYCLNKRFLKNQYTYSFLAKKKN
jgi:hypothetical protein